MSARGDYNKLKHASESATHPPPPSPNSLNPPGQPLEHSYSILSATTSDMEASSSLPPPLPPPLSEDDLLQHSPRKNQREKKIGRRDGDTGEAVYYNDTTALGSIDEEDEGEPLSSEDVQYANC